MAIDKLPGTAIATDAITADQLATGSITVADIPTGEITADKLHTTLNLSSKTLTLPNGVISINNISDVNTSGVANGKILKYNGSAWVIADDAGGPADTDALSEGSSNLYFTNARARSAISENSTQLAYNNSTGVLTFIQGNTDTVGEGTSNLYFTNTRADARADLRITNALKDEDNMASNSATHVPSQQSVKAYADTKLALTGGTLTGNLAHTGSLTIDVVGDITLDAGGGDVNFEDDGVRYGFLAKYNNDLWIGNSIADGDVAIRGNDSDGGGNITAISFDMSAAGRATFNSDVIMPRYLEHTGDSDTFIGFPSADTFNVTTGATSALTINSSQNVGIGTDNPRRHFHINGGNESTKIQITNQTTGSGSDGEGFQLGIATNGTANLEQRENADMVFSTNNTERMRIDSNGKVVMGFTSGRVPVSVLVPHSNSAITTAMRISTHGVSGYSSSNSSNAGARLEFGQYDDGYDWVTGSIDSPRTGGNWGGDLVFSTNNDSASTNQTERMRINSSGNVGIGATNPGGSRLYVQDTHTTTVTNATQLISNTTLTINGNSSQGSDVMRMGPMGTSGRYFIDVSNSAGSAAYDLLLNPTGGGKVGINQTSANFNLDVNGGMRVMNAGNDSYGQLYIQATGTGDAQIAFVTTANGRSIYVDQNDSNKMRFSTGWGKGVAYKEMVIDNDANLICGGGTKEGRGITLYGSGGNGFYSVTTGTSFYCITNHQSTSSTGTISTFYNNATYCGGISITGTNQTLFQSGSDYRLKENIVDMADGATAILKKLRPRTFNFKSEPGNTIDGFIAHEVEGIVDNAVSGIKDEVYDEAGAEDNPNVDVGDPKYQGIDPGKMVPLLVKTIQELEARITQLESA